jgi:molecular chaperone HscB
MQNHFELFGLPAKFSIDQARLEQSFREVQSKVHPDRFVNESDAERRVAMQWATRANEAYQTLKSPLNRARYLCELSGVELGMERNTAMAPQFLMQQMEWREELDHAVSNRDETALDAVEAQLETARRETERVTAHALDDGQDLALAAQLVRQWMFIEKFAEDVYAARDRFAD